MPYCARTGVLVLCLAAASLAGCVDVRSEAFSCRVDSDCDAPRFCRDSWCVLSDSDGTDAGTPLSSCAPPNEAGRDVEIAAELAGLYAAYDLGKVPGVPAALGGVTLKYGDPNTLLVAGHTESADGAIYEVAIERAACGHIVGFAGEATLVAQTPFVDANLAYVPGDDLLVYSEWPKYTVSQLPFGAAAPAARTDLAPLGLPTDGDQGPGGLGFVPPGFGAHSGTLRIVTWPAGGWYRLDATADGDLLDITGLSHVVSLPNSPGGFAYVPAGSPGLPPAAIIVNEWREDDAKQDRVVVYETDDAGNPIPATRRELLHKVPRPWGAYVDPVSGDYLVTTNDRVFVIQGFAEP